MNEWIDSLIHKIQENNVHIIVFHDFNVFHHNYDTLGIDCLGRMSEKLRIGFAMNHESLSIIHKPARFLQLIKVVSVHVFVDIFWRSIDWRAYWFIFSPRLVIHIIGLIITSSKTWVHALKNTTTNEAIPCYKQVEATDGKILLT